MNGPDKRMLEREVLRNMIQQWNVNRLDLFELSEPNEDLSFHGVMRFYFQDSGQKVATKCIRVASDATAADVIETLIEKFRPDMRMLSVASYALYELHSHEERKLGNDEKPLLVQLNWHIDDREGRFLLKNVDHKTSSVVSNVDANSNFKRKLSKREKKELKKKEKLSRMKSDAGKDEDYPVAEKLYNELPETSFTRSISNPEAVMRRRRQQKLERKLQQFRSKDGGPDTGGTLKIYGESLCSDVPYKTLLLSINDCAAGVVKEMLDKYGLGKLDSQLYCLVQVDGHDNSEYILDDDECPLAIVMTHPHRGSIMFHVRRRPADCQPRRRKKKSGSLRTGTGGPCAGLLLETQPDGTPVDNGRSVRLATDVVEVGSASGVALQLYGPNIQPRHCVVAAIDGMVTITPVHADAHTYINGQQIYHTTILQHGCLIKFGRTSTFRFVDPSHDNSLNRNLSQSQHFDSGSVYDRSPVPDSISGMMSPSIHSQLDGLQSSIETSGMNVTDMSDLHRAMSPTSASNNTMTGSQENFPLTPYNGKNQRHSTDSISAYKNNNNHLKGDGESMILPGSANSKADIMQENYFSPNYNDMMNSQSSANNKEEQTSTNKNYGMEYKDNYETTFDLDGNVETKSVCSIKSGGSGNDSRLPRGQEAILPAVLEFPEHTQQLFLHSVITELDVEAPTFKLAPVYTLYMCARYRASTHYRPELTPTERAHKLTALLQHVATLIQNTVQERHGDASAEAFWMANGSELLHFLKSDRHISAFSTQAQNILAHSVQTAFSNLVGCFHVELSSVLSQWLEETVSETAGALLLGALGSAMALLRRCRVNAALTIQLFSQLFHFINVWCFNKVVHSPHMWRSGWGTLIRERLAPLAHWAERQGLEIAADCHLATIHQCAHLLQAPKNTVEDMVSVSASCFKLNSVQLTCLLGGFIDDNGRRLAPELVQAAVQHAQGLADELHRADGREITLEESSTLPLSLLIPEDGFSTDVVRGLVAGLAEFLAPLQRAGLCRLTPQPHSQGHWTVYMNGYQGGFIVSSPPQQPLVQVIKLHKNSNGMGLSIVAAKGAGQSKLGIYIKSVVPGGAAAADQRLQAGDQLLSVDGHSLVGISQERAAEFLVRTGPVVTLEVAKQGAVLHGLATLLRQPSPNRGPRRMSERDLPSTLEAEQSGQHGMVKSSKSVPALHEVFNPGYSRTSSSNSIPTLAGLRNRSSQQSHQHNDPNNFYQNLSTYKHTGFQDRSLSLAKGNISGSDHPGTQPVLKGGNRPQSAYCANPPPLTTQQLHAGYPSMPNVNESYNTNPSVNNSYSDSPGQPMKGWKGSQPVTPRTPMMPHPSHQNISHQQVTSPHQLHRSQYLSDEQNQQMQMNVPMSPTKQQPPVAPKPQGMKRGASGEMISQDVVEGPPLPPTATHPLYQQNDEVGGSYLASSSEPPAVSLYPHAGVTSPPQALSNPWHREEREKELEARRVAARVWRDKQISALQSLGEENRTPQQEQQLRALTLERDFQRRAQEAQTEEEEKNHDQTQDNTFQENQDVISQQKQENIITQSQETKVLSPQMPLSPPVQPKSILKSNLRLDNLNSNSPQSPSKTQKNTSFVTKPPPQSLKFDNMPKYEVNTQQSENSKYDHNVNNKMYKSEYNNIKYPEQMHKMLGKYQHQDYPYNNLNSQNLSKFEHSMSENNVPLSQLSQNINNMTINTSENYMRGESAESQQRYETQLQEETPYQPPPPPERGSSFVVMSQQQALRSSCTISDTSVSQPSRDNKRVSFHHNSQADSSPSEIHQVETLREDPDKFISEAESMLQSPTTPTGSHMHTPGVIGAQEVYRDPRQRRLAEQQKAQQAENSPIPEKLSFKEKMKMFALESGESNTPKDKVKISRAQRDIDAVH